MMSINAYLLFISLVWRGGSMNLDSDRQTWLWGKMTTQNGHDDGKTRTPTLEEDSMLSIVAIT